MKELCGCSGEDGHKAGTAFRIVCDRAGRFRNSPDRDGARYYEAD